MDFSETIVVYDIKIARYSYSSFFHLTGRVAKLLIILTVHNGL